MSTMVEELREMARKDNAAPEQVAAFPEQQQALPPFKIDRHRVALARQALGKEPLARFPPPH